MKKQYIITGGAGFIGSAIAKKLAGLGDGVHIIDDLSSGFIENIPKVAGFHKIDISDKSPMQSFEIPGKVDAVFHLAAQPSGEVSFDNPARDIDVNFKGTYNVLDLARRLKCKRFVYASSMSVYGDAKGKVKENSPCDPASYYGVNKLASEKLIRIYAENAGINATCFRMFNVYGPGQNMSNLRQGMVSIYLSYIMKDQPIQVKGSLDRFRDFVFIDDVVDAFINHLNEPKAVGEVFNLGTGRKTTVKALLRNILKAYGKDDFSKWVFVKGKTAGDIKGFIADISKAKNKLGWFPKVKIKAGLAEMKEWIDK